MIRRVLQAVYKEVQGLHQAAYILAVFTFGSQILALIRDRLLAHEFGAGTELDLYYAAFRIPDLLYVLFASALSVYVLIPFISERIQGDNYRAGRAFLSQIFSVFLIAYAVLAAVLAVAAPFIVPVAFPGFSAHTDELVLLLRILLLQPFFLGLSSLFGVITQLKNRFILYAVSPLIYNLGIIAGLLFLYPTFGLVGLVFGVVIGALGHVAVQLPFVLKSELTPSLTFSISLVEMREVFSSSLPRALTLSLHQIVLLGLIGIASIMAAGSVSVFQFAFNLQSVPLAVIGVSYSVAAFPVLARLSAERNMQAFAAQLVTALRHIIFWSVPALALLIVIRAQFVRVILGTGEFDWDDTRLTAATLALFAVSLLAQAVNLLMVRALYAVGETRKPLYVTIVSSISIFVLALGLYEVFTHSYAFRSGLEALLRVQDVPGTEVLVLALSYTIALVFHSAALTALAAPRLSFSLAPFRTYLFQALVAAFCGSLAAYTTLNFFVEGLRTETLLGIFLQGLLAGVLGVGAATWAYYMQGSEELKETYRTLHRRVFKVNVALPQDEDHLAV